MCDERAYVRPVFADLFCAFDRQSPDGEGSCPQALGIPHVHGDAPKGQDAACPAGAVPVFLCAARGNRGGRGGRLYGACL